MADPYLIDYEIEKALFNRLAYLQVPDGNMLLTTHSDGTPFSDTSQYSQPAVVPVAMPNEHKEDLPIIYVRVAHFRNDNVRRAMTAQGAVGRMGVLQLTVVSPLNWGAPHATRLAGYVANHFLADQRLQGDGVSIKIERAADVGSALKEEASWDVPVSVRYVCYK